ncbi:MAG: MFS transporter [Deltaproteobacteria bacterium]|nr:MFS transporter [Deltaproteobacteria bacterium]
MKKPKLFYGWWVVWALIPACIVHSGAAFYVFGIFYKPFGLEFGWSRAEIALNMTIYLLTMGLSSPIIGKLTEIFNPRKTIITGAVVGGICFILASRVTALWQLYLLYFIIGWSYAACGAIPASTVVANWFIDKRGLALGIAMAGISLGGFIIAPAGAFFMEAFGWRPTYLFLAATSFLIVIPPALFIVRNTPQEMGLLPYGADPQAAAEKPDPAIHITDIPPGPENQWTLAGVMKTPAFWFICLSVSLVYVGVGTVLQHQIMHLSDMGISLTAAAVALGMTGAFGAMGKVAFGFICDRIAAKSAAVFCFALQAFGILILLFAESMTLIWVFVIIFGFAMGGQYALQPLVSVYFFGLRSFATIYGVVYMSSSIGSAAGPLAAAFLYDKTGSYRYAFAACVAAALLASIIMLSIKKPAADAGS